ncbi:MAG TPA: hypothetical protein VF505_16375 [Thermoanaerobaculia bacterium]
MADVTEVIWKQIARLFAKSLGDSNEVFNIEPALIRFQSREVRRRDPDTPGHVGLAARFRFAELPEDPTVHILPDARNVPNRQYF